MCFKFFTANFILLGFIEPQLSFIFKPFGLTPIGITLAPNSFNNLGAALYPAPLAQSKTIFVPRKLKFLENSFSIYLYICHFHFLIF